MSPAVFVFLPFALLLLMSKGAGAHSVKPKQDKPTSSGKVMGILTEKGDFIPFPSLTSNDNVNAYEDGIVIEQNGKRYMLATVSEQDS
jgi:hypothetical protein